MNTTERKARNDQIVLLKARGMTYDSIASTLEIHRDTAIEVVKEFRASQPKLRHQDPLEIIEDILEGYQADLSELAMVSSATKNEAVRVGAINARMGARDRIVALLQATGILPRELGRLRVELDVRFIAEQVIVIMEKYGLPEEGMDELLKLMGTADDEPVTNGHPVAVD